MTRLDEKDQQRCFGKHVAEYKKLDENMELLEWGQPEHSNGRIIYIIRGATLMVYGDHYEAIYRWSGSIDFQFLAGCHLGYFHEKCCASPNGREFRTWDEKEAVADFKEYVKDHLRDNMTADEVREWKTKWADDYDSCLSGLQEGSQFFWHACLSEHSDFRSEGLGDDDHYLFTIGMPIDVQCQIHLIGIRMAVKQLEEKGVFEKEKVEA
jgi:hypothetical protein